MTQGNEMKWKQRFYSLFAPLPQQSTSLNFVIQTLSCPYCPSLPWFLFIFFFFFYLLFHFTWNQLHKLENHPLSYYLEPASTPGNYLTILSTLSSHYIRKFYSRLAIYVCQKLWILFILFALYYSSIFHKLVLKCLILNLI